ncbi:MAG: c-type cytochrome, partial [Flavisolibacter sp.]
METMRPFRLIIWILAGVILAVILFISFIGTKSDLSKKQRLISSSVREIFQWEAPDIEQLPFTREGTLIRYGKNLVANTSVYLGPKGTVARITNGMNCQNCHLEAGTKNWGNNYSAVFSTYPKFRERSGTIENIYKRVNDCIERSLNGKQGIDTTSQEMQAIAAYINWLGHAVPKNLKPTGSGIKDLPFPDRATDPAKGKIIYTQICQRCHGINGEGLLNADSTRYMYPPLWGKNSYTTAAGLFRISRFAGFVRYNMPYDKTSNASPLTDEEAWDVAAFVNSQPRP